ncbi:MAG: Gx transporter family protein, partial [Peptococcaceae bacterium]|nr:Gx transporter family protein [Peptococcaceae bacterium]
LLSTMIMSVMWHYLNKQVSIVNISIIGAICHNIGQLFVAAVMGGGFHVYILLPVLMISAIITGYIVGLVSKYVYKQLLDRGMGDYRLS